MDILDFMDAPVLIDSLQLLMFVIAFFAVGLITLTIVITNKGYELNARFISANLAGAMAAVVLFGAALGIFIIAMVMSPGFVSVPFAANEKLETFFTVFIVAFMVALAGATFLVYTKRGGF